MAALIFDVCKRRHDEEIKKQAIKLYMESNSGRAVGRILVISINTCIYWIKKYARTIEEKVFPKEKKTEFT